MPWRICRSEGLRRLFVLFAVCGGLDSGEQVQLPDWCKDKRDDCARYSGRGPMGGGCTRHEQYMRLFCARTCRFCEKPEDELHMTQALIAGEPVGVLKARGVRRWAFMELPVTNVSEDPSCLVGEEACPASSSQVRRSHVASAHFYDSLSHDLNSSIYRWQPASAGFELHQALPTSGAWAITSFQLSGDVFLAVASFFDGTSRKLNSRLYRWDVVADMFVWHQDLATEGAKDVEFLALSTSLAVLAFAGHGVDDSVGECRLFIWEPASRRFELLQVLATSGAYDVEAFTPSGEKGLLVVHEDDTDVYMAEWQGDTLKGFAKIQSLGFSHGRDAEHVAWRERDFVVLCIFRDETSYEVDSRIFEWGSRALSEVQRFPSVGAFDAEMLHLGLAPVLLVANQRSGTSLVYELGETDTCPKLVCQRGDLATPKVYNVAAHFVPEAQMSFLAIANYWD